MSRNMPRTAKLFLMFAPLALLFAGLFVVVGDMRHPTVASDECVVSATGEDVAKIARVRPESRTIYRQSQNAVNDISLQCRRMGTLLLNDLQLFLTRIDRGQKATISHKVYRFLPERWAVSVQTGKEE